jgi:hypothetical protein
MCLNVLVPKCEKFATLLYVSVPYLDGFKIQSPREKVCKDTGMKSPLNKQSKRLKFDCFFLLKVSFLAQGLGLQKGNRVKAL